MTKIIEKKCSKCEKFIDGDSCGISGVDLVWKLSLKILILNFKPFSV
jgi:hypothetical protein